MKESLKDVDVLMGAVRILERDWGANCTENDSEVVPYPRTRKEYLLWLESRCQSCRAKEVIDLIKKSVEYLKSES